jgi:hypothetical protein
MRTFHNYPHDTPAYFCEDWSKAFTRTPQTLSFTALLQQEAICFTRDGQSVYVSSEGQSAPLLYINLEAVPSTQ